jgi:hypothetical protein
MLAQKPVLCRLVRGLKFDSAFATTYLSSWFRLLMKCFDFMDNLTKLDLRVRGNCGPLLIGSRFLLEHAVLYTEYDAHLTEWLHTQVNLRSLRIRPSSSPLSLRPPLLPKLVNVEACAELVAAIAPTCPLVKVGFMAAAPDLSSILTTGIPTVGRFRGAFITSLTLAVYKINIPELCRVTSMYLPQVNRLAISQSNFPQVSSIPYLMQHLPILIDVSKLTARSR